jgi:hypothetical protein
MFFKTQNCSHSAKAKGPRPFGKGNAKARLACKWIPYLSKQRQKLAFRAVPKLLKFSAAAFA